MMRHGLSVLMVAMMVGVGLAAAASAEPIPPFDGAMSFQPIYNSEGPEEFSWQVKLGEDEELRAIDETHAGVFWVGEETLAMTITAVLAHAADGANVPTTLAVTQPNVITLTVHHRAGNPAASGAPFDYPVNAGSGWDGGIQTHVVMGPPTEQAIPPPALRCIVPDLSGRTVRASLRQLRRANCALGEVRGERSRGARVARQFRKPGRSLPVGTAVDVKVLRPGQYSRSS